MQTIRQHLRRALSHPGQRKITILLLVYAALALVLFYSYIYNDILETTRMGIHFWEMLFDGRIRDFYVTSAAMNPAAYAKDVQASYDFPIYILFAVWDFPLYLISRFAGIDVFQSLGCLLWVKTMLLVCSFVFARAFYLLARTAGLERERALLACILFYTSNLFMTSVVVLSAYDLLALLFVVRGMTCWLKGDPKGFLLQFMLAVPLKMFALLIFLPLLLLRQKNVLKILGCSVLGMVLVPLCRILIPCAGGGFGIQLADMFRGTELGNVAVSYIITYHSDMVLGEIYYSVIAFGILMAVCYFIRPETADQYCTWGIYVCFLSYAVLFTTCISHPYWVIMLIPFTSLLTMRNKESVHINTLLDTVGTWGILLAQLFYFPWCFGNALVTNLFWPKLLGSKEFEQFHLVSLLSSRIDAETLRKLTNGAESLGSTVFLACILMMSVLNFPPVQHLLYGKTGSRSLTLIHSDGSAEGWVFVLRLLSGAALGLLPLVMYVLWIAQ